jgi:hypothetical protein
MITVVGAADYDVDVPRIELTVTATPSVTAPLSVYRIHEDGSEWLLLSEDAPQLIGGTWVGFDYHPPLEQDCTYRAETAAESGTSTAMSMPAGVNVTWLVHPSEPALSVQVDRVISWSPPVHPPVSLMTRILGSSRPVHQSDSPRQALSGSITIACDSLAAENAMYALLADGGPILLNSSRDRDFQWLWVQPGDVSVENAAGSYLGYPSRRFVIPLQATTQPDVDVTPVWTDGDLTATGWTSAEAEAMYATDADMKLDNRIP